MSRVEPNRNIYVGHRYVPKIFGEWDKQNEYEGLSIVTNQGNSYTSKKRVPVGIDILNDEFWVVTGNYNAQVEYYRDEVRTLSTDVGNNSTTLIEHDTRIKSNASEIDILEIDLDDTVTNVASLSNRLNTVEDLTDPTIDKIDLSVPTDFNDLQSAVDYSLKLKQGIKVEITMETGYKPSKGIYIEDQDASFIKISSVDDIVEVSNNYTGHFIHVYKAHAPVLNCLVDMRDMGQDGLRVNYTSKASVLSQCGVINAGGAGVYCRTSTVSGAYSKFTGANDRAAWITRGSNVSFAQADFSGVKQGTVGIYVSRASIADFSDVIINDCNVTGWAIYVVRSKANFINGQLNNSSGGGLIATSSSEVVASEISAMNATNTAVYINRSSKVNLGSTSNLSNAGDKGLHVVNGSSANAVGLNVTRSGENPIVVEAGSTVNITDGNARNCNGDGVLVSGASNANLPRCIISTATGIGLDVKDGSNVNFENGFIQAVNGFGIDITHGSTVNARNALVDGTVVQAGTPETGTGIRLSYGSTLNLILAEVRNSTLNDLNVRYGSTVAGYNFKTTNGTPSIDDTNMTAFNTPSGRGIMYV